MTRHIKVGDLRRLIEEAVGDKDPAGESGVSLDAQVDKYLSEYEQEAKQAKQEGKDFRSLIKRLLSEAGDDKSAAPDADTGAAPSKASIHDIDVESFANSIVRLIQNYDNLLEVRSTLIRRSTNFLGKVYDNEVVEQYEQVLREQHGMEAGKEKEEVADEQFPAPPGDRAGDGGSGPGAGPGS